MVEKTQVMVADVYVVDLATREETRVLGEMTFGRAEGDKLYPTDPQISRRHFRLIQAQGEVLVEDLGSTNRTKVNGGVLKPGLRYKLRSRDVVEFGKQKIQVFIGGALMADAKTLAGQPETAAEPEQTERSMVFERFCSADQIAPAGAYQDGPGVELEVEGGVPPGSSRTDDALVEQLVRKKNAAWYLLFEGSEFGPLSLKEMKVFLGSKQFQGGQLYAFTEGLADWLPAQRLQGLLELPGAEFTGTQQVGSWVPFAAVVHCLLEPATGRKLTGRCDSVSLSELTVKLPSALPEGLAMLEVEVLPEPETGIDPFRAVVKVDPTRSSAGAYTLLFVQAKPSTKIAIERYLRGQG